jgi:hypothetical protein
VGNLLSAEVIIEGFRPYFWHFFGPDAIPLERGERTGVAGNDPESWKKTVLFTQDKKRTLLVMPTQVFRCVRDGARHTKLGKGSLQSKVEATLQVTDTMIAFDRSLPEEKDLKINDYTSSVYIDQRGTKNPATKAKNVTYRVVASPPWTLTYHLMWDKTVVSREQMEAINIDAGMLEGLGNARKIGMGRFHITAFTVKDETKR